MKSKAASPNPLVGLKAKVAIERNGASIEISDVEAKDAFSVLVELLDGMRLAVKVYPELIPDLEPVGGSCVPYSDHEDFDGKRLGFR